ncbi:hypothetical protein BX661DRAFT_176129 [Kickxella alabastrina]|uniref:uncharacterized protein n=1 Tax=Kickxella alabastrina TaxID=61397 RepID=UPI00221FD6ED|nr:uncharacterized protein BX661DRAFT_176129 [Kickxella alabastrina]KAI7835127.1 hypothetical protein BX661DRAFT_176129 [Kickxella alabastrina]
MVTECSHFTHLYNYNFTILYLINYICLTKQQIPCAILQVKFATAPSCNFFSLDKMKRPKEEKLVLSRLMIWKWMLRLRAVKRVFIDMPINRA